ncbi:hypothetical protein PR048_006977 [Dryococelus australis]|uniref:Uncharacterized protein n=1 Tax=Dryococelus australis TaxID=614101 RepID=A0ABQ9ICF2_9NEOP|nr:hypothetical protein PR048_006977 [Dryococelus australis]
MTDYSRAPPFTAKKKKVMDFVMISVGRRRLTNHGAPAKRWATWIPEFIYDSAIERFIATLLKANHKKKNGNYRPVHTAYGDRNPEVISRTRPCLTHGYGATARRRSGSVCRARPVNKVETRPAPSHSESIIFYTPSPLSPEDRGAEIPPRRLPFRWSFLPLLVFYRSELSYSFTHQLQLHTRGPEACLNIYSVTLTIPKVQRIPGPNKRTGLLVNLYRAWWRSGNSHSGGHGFDSLSGHPDFGCPWFSEITVGECWDGSLTKAMADSFPPIPLPCATCTVSNDLPVDETGLRDEQFDAGHLWSRGSGSCRKSLDKCVLKHVQRAAVGTALIDLLLQTLIVYTLYNTWLHFLSGPSVCLCPVDPRRDEVIEMQLGGPLISFRYNTQPTATHISLPLVTSPAAWNSSTHILQLNSTQLPASRPVAILIPFNLTIWKVQRTPSRAERTRPVIQKILRINAEINTARVSRIRRNIDYRVGSFFVTDMRSPAYHSEHYTDVPPPLSYNCCLRLPALGGPATRRDGPRYAGVNQPEVRGRSQTGASLDAADPPPPSLSHTLTHTAAASSPSTKLKGENKCVGNASNETVLVQNCITLSAHEGGAMSFWCNFLDSVKLRLHEAKEYPESSTLAGLQKSVGCASAVVQREVLLISSPPMSAHRLHTAIRRTDQEKIVLRIQRGRGGVVARLLACQLGESGSTPGGVAPDFSTWQSSRTTPPLAGGFSRGYPVSPALAFRRCSTLIRLTLIWLS